MTKAITILQTIFIFLWPLASEGFNLSLSFACPHSAPHGRCCTAAGASATAVPHRLPLSLSGGTKLHAFGQKMGKVIKESTIAATDYKIKTVVIDPGHGGHDPGCLGSSSQEKHLALAIALKLAEKMRQDFPGIRVILTRDRDVFIPLHQRAAIANRNDADLFISIHCNYMPGSRATHGSETFVMGLHTADHNLEVAKRENAVILYEDDYQKNYDYDPNSPEGHILLSMFQNAFLEQSILFAEKVEEKFATYAQRKSRGVKQAGFVVLKETAMPSVLVEVGFLSNREEEAYLKDEEGQLAIAGSILTAFDEYKAMVEGTAPKLAGRVPARPAIPSPGPPKAEGPAFAQGPPAAPVPSAPLKGEGGQAVSPGPPTSSSKVLVLHPSSASAPQTAGASPIKEEPLPARPANIPRGEATPAASRLPELPANIQFHVQLAATSRALDTRDDKWRNTGYLIELVREDNLYKYQARNFSSLEQAFEARLLLQSRGFPDAFIVAYKDGRRISVEQAKKELGIP
jgi:N-acetylmuramoyl-L-alanine amidase